MQVTIKIEDNSYTFEQDVFNGYRGEYFKLLSEIETRKKQLKEVEETLEEATKIPKNILKKYLSTSYKAAIADKEEELEILKTIDSALNKNK